ncbi:MAG: aldehyde dehydrogenase family protein, partial [Candidatus Thermoplasmatota archaeon]|nr:aldehyde dehydrogenase family protein [Candidatus Thermoplasmatota archaeon]
GYSGQKCSAASLAYVHEKVYDKFLDLLMERVSRIKVGDPREKDTYMGPVVNRQAFEKYKGIFSKLGTRGRILHGGKVVDKYGFYVEPTVISDISENDELVQNEQFLPILCIIKVKSVKEAIDKINKFDYGLTGGIFSEDEAEIKYYFDHVEVGVVYANRSKGATTGAMVGSQPFVGWKLSGSSGKGTGSYYYLPQFLREQSLTIER